MNNLPISPERTSTFAEFRLVRWVDHSLCHVILVAILMRHLLSQKVVNQFPGVFGCRIRHQPRRLKAVERL